MQQIDDMREFAGDTNVRTYIPACLLVNMVSAVLVCCLVVHIHMLHFISFRSISFQYGRHARRDSEHLLEKRHSEVGGDEALGDVFESGGVTHPDASVTSGTNPIGGGRGSIRFTHSGFEHSVCDISFSIIILFIS
jgi:hypothetical protein